MHRFGLLLYAVLATVLILTRRMHRLTAKLLLLIALLGNLGPLALAAAAAPPRACCLRKTVHPCHGSVNSEPDAGQVSETGQLVLHDTSCCHHDCCRGVTTTQWAQAQPSTVTAIPQNVAAYLARSTQVSPNPEVFRFQSTRAPPPAC